MSDRDDRPEGESDPELRKDFDEFLAGLRTSLPGIQVLIAFLLILPLQSGFDDADDIQRVVYLASFLASMGGAVLLIAPSMHQRVRAPTTGIRRRSDTHVGTAIRLAIAGSVLTACALVGVSYLATSFVFSTGIAVGVAAVVGVGLAVTWFAIPLRWSREG